MSIYPIKTNGIWQGHLVPLLRDLAKSVGGSYNDNNIIVPGSQGVSYFAAGNYGSDSNDGLSWDSPFKTMTYALAISHANIAASSRGWAARNKIYAQGDWFVEDLVLGCQKTDIIGVGSADGYKGAGLTGNHAFDTITAMGTRWINFNFRPTAADDIFTLINKTQSMEFLGCVFEANGTLVALSAIDATASNFMKIRGCEFNGAFAEAVIDIGAGAFDSFRMTDNEIVGGASHGLQLTGTPTVTGGSGRKGLIANNLINVAGITIDDNGDGIVYMSDNTLISAAAYGTNSYVMASAYACNNRLTANGAAYPVPVWTNIEI